MTHSSVVRVDHAEIEAQLAVLNGVLNEIDGKNQEINTNKNELMAGFVGAGADGYQDVMGRWTKNQMEFQGSLGRLRQAIQIVSDEFHRVDVASGNRFLSH